MNGFLFSSNADLSIRKYMSLQCTTYGMVGHFLANFVYIYIRTGNVTGKIRTKIVTFSVRNINIYKIRKLREAIFSVFYNICKPNFAILLILRCSFEL